MFPTQLPLRGSATATATLARLCSTRCSMSPGHTTGVTRDPVHRNPFPSTGTPSPGCLPSRSPLGTSVPHSGVLPQRAAHRVFRQTSCLHTQGPGLTPCPAPHFPDSLTRRTLPANPKQARQMSHRAVQDAPGNRPTRRTRIGNLCATRLKQSRAACSETPASSNSIVPGFTIATQ